MTVAASVDGSNLCGKAFSAFLLLVAAWTVYKGIELTRFDLLHRAVASILSLDVPKRPTQAELTASRESLGAWRDTIGVRFLARSDYNDIGETLYLPPSISMVDAAQIVQVDPVYADTWLDIAEGSWSDSNTRALSLAAWEMSAIVAPREAKAIQRRIVFLLAVWTEAPEAQRRRMFFEVDSLLDNTKYFRFEWRRMLALLSDDRRQEVERAFLNYNPAYRR